MSTTLTLARRTSTRNAVTTLRNDTKAEYFYIYAGDDPVDNTDPTGLSVWHSIVNVVASAAYTPYYVLHESRAYIWGGAGALALETASLGADMGIDWVKKQFGWERSVCDEGSGQRLTVVGGKRNHFLPGCRYVHGHRVIDLP